MTLNPLVHQEILIAILKDIFTDEASWAPCWI